MGKHIFDWAIGQQSPCRSKPKASSIATPMGTSSDRNTKNDHLSFDASVPNNNGERLIVLEKNKFKKKKN